MKRKRNITFMTIPHSPAQTCIGQSRDAKVECGDAEDEDEALGAVGCG
jgi:hypothetical protein